MNSTTQGSTIGQVSTNARTPIAETMIGMLASLLMTPAIHADSLKLVEVAAGGRTYLDDRIPIVDGRVIISADDDGDGITDVFSVPIDGSPSVRLNGPLADPFTFAFARDVSRDGTTVVYEVDGNAGLRLYSVPLDGPETLAVRLDLDVPWDLDINRILLSGDGQRVLFEGNQDDEEVYGIFSVPVDGPASAMVRLNESLLGNSASSLRLTPDGQTALYRADENAADSREELHAVPVDGSAAPIQLSNGGEVGFNYVMSETHVVYYRRNALFSVPLTGPASASVQISPTLPRGDNVRANFFEITPDGQTVVFRIDENSVERVFAAPIDGPDSEAVAITPVEHDVSEHVLVGNSNIVYDARRSEGGRELYSIALNDSSKMAVKLNPEITAENGSTSTFKVSPDGSRVVFQGTLETDGKSELWSAPIEGPASETIKLNPPIPSSADVFFDFIISPDSQRVAYRLDLDRNDVFDLYSIPIEGPQGSGIKINGPLASGGDVCNASTANCYFFAPDSKRLIYEAEEDARFEVELFIGDDGSAELGFADAPDIVYENSTIFLDIDIGSPTVRPVTLTIAQTGGSATEADFALSSQVTIPPGETTAQVSVEIVADSERDAGETLELSLTEVQNVAVGPASTVTLTIRPEGEIFFSGFE